MTDFTVPQRMSRSAFFIILAKTSKSILGPIIIFIFIKVSGADFNPADGATWLKTLAILGAFLALSLLSAFIAYYPKKFYIKDGNLIFSHGLIKRENTCIPLERIHSLRTRQDFWYRLLEMRGIVFDTLASKKEEIELILDESDWKRLLLQIEKEEHPQCVSPPGIPPEYNPTSVLRFDNKDLLIDTLCQNHLKGMAILAGFIAVILDRIGDFSDNATATVTNYAVSHLDEFLESPLKIIASLATVYVAVLTLWLGKALLRYYGMSLTYDKKFLSFTHGLISRSSSRFSYDKICTIWVKRNFFEKKFGLCTLMLKQALNVSAKKEEDNMKLYGSDYSSFFLGWWLGKDYKELPDIMAAKSGKGVFFHTIFPDFMLAVIAAAILWHFQLYLWLLLPTIYVMFSLLASICAMRHSKITLRESYFIINNGHFAEIENYIKYNNLEVVSISRTPLTKWFGRVTLTFSTSGTNYSVRSLKEDEALRIYEFLLSRTERQPLITAIS